MGGVQPPGVDEASRVPFITCCFTDCTGGRYPACLPMAARHPHASVRSCTPGDASASVDGIAQAHGPGRASQRSEPSHVAPETLSASRVRGAAVYLCLL